MTSASIGTDQLCSEEESHDREDTKACVEQNYL